ncbi:MULTISPECIES: hypothetical protein [Virgibacillus]|jgi:diamine N-acetyltransferase|uniref:hypothetical protein n=1 Tax=Virgibacillus TaxID=84406 RepID=UPI0002EA9069|nr:MULTISPECIES: hypothetical protein [Virgibacillus]AIF42300.1 hypothetical protein X953_02535 [Virgibacillus sp. SK37]MEC2159111.1 hypothetical protein [Virgibacillus halodenitrificans]WHX25258.1 hypothetical protein QNH47_13975 [Virgibacillus halodenitrificans]CDQ37385.1 hypothetical protein BN993_06934 [Virgibacillus halodenitrificans]
MVYTAFLEKEKNKEELKEELDTLEIQLFRMQNNIKEIAKKSEVISIDQARDEQWVVIYADRDEEVCQLMLHDCTKPFRGKWDSAIQVEYREGSTLHIADIKGEENKGYGSVLMHHLKEVAREDNFQYITGDIVERDFDHVDRLKHFYSKHHFDVKIDHQEQCGEIIWNDR